MCDALVLGPHLPHGEGACRLCGLASRSRGWVCQGEERGSAQEMGLQEPGVEGVGQSQEKEMMGWWMLAMSRELWIGLISDGLSCFFQK